MNRENVLRDFGNRLLTLLVIAALLSYGFAALQKRISDETLLRWHGIEGEELFRYSLSPHEDAYILENEEAGTVTFVMMRDEQWFAWQELSPRFRDIHYAGEVRTSDLELLRTHYWHYNETTTDRIYWTEQFLWHQSELGRYQTKYLGRGITLEPERLAGQDVLFQKEIGEATVFCILSDKLRSIITEEDMRQSAY